MKSVCLFALAGLAAASVIERGAACNADNCLRALRGTRSNAGTSRPAIAKADCSSYFSTVVTSTVTPSTTTVFPTVSVTTSTTATDTSIVVVTITNTEVDSVTTTTSTSDTTAITEVAKRAPASVITIYASACGGPEPHSSASPIPSHASACEGPACGGPEPHSSASPIPSYASAFPIPSYASACEGPERYSSACSCLGVTATTSTLMITLATPTATVFVTASTVITAVATSLTTTLIPVTTTTLTTVTDTTTAEATVTCSVGAQIVSNPSFEQHNFFSPLDWTQQSSQSSLEDFDLCGEDGSRCEYFVGNNGPVSGSVSQTLTAACPGATYAFSAFVGYYHSGTAPFATYVTVTLDGVTVIPRQLTCGGANACNISPSQSPSFFYREIVGTATVTAFNPVLVVLLDSLASSQQIYDTTLDNVQLIQM